MKKKKGNRHFVLIHGYAETPDRVWFPWLEKVLLDRGATVETLRLPDPLRPRAKQWFDAALRAAKSWNGETVVVAHSLGGVAALRAIERSQKSVAGFVLIASPFCALIRISPFIEFFGERIDWEKLRRNAGTIDILQAKDDPLVPFDHALRYAEALKGRLTLVDKGGHFTAKSSEVLRRIVLRYL